MATGSARQVAAAVIVACLVLHAAMCMEPGQSGSDSSAGDIFQKGINEMLKVMDRNVHPCDDFYTYACGHWPEQHPILIGESHVDASSAMDAKLSNKLKDLLADGIKAEDGEAIAKAKTLYRSCMDESQIDQNSARHLIELLDAEFGGWPLLGPSVAPTDSSQASSSSRGGGSVVSSTEKWVKIMAILSTYNDEAIIGQSVGTRQNGEPENSIHLYPANLGMSLDKYFKEVPFLNVYEKHFIAEAISKNPNLEVYRKYLTKTAKLLGADNLNLASDVDKILELEMGLAKHLKIAERDNSVRPSLKTLAKLEKRAPLINWDKYLQHSLPGLTFDKSRLIDFNGFTVIGSLLDLITYSTSETTIINYLIWRFVMNRMDTLGSKFAKIKREFEAELSGSKSKLELELETPRDQVCIDLVRNKMGMAVDLLYVKHYFNAEFEREAETMITSIHTHFSNILRYADWMDSSTRNFAAEKSDLLMQNVGSPKWIMNPNLLAQVYQQLKFSPDYFFSNVIQILKLNAEQTRWKLGKLSSRNEWLVPASSSKVSYSAKKNVISLPAGALQPPLFHPRYPKSLNYGAIGSIIGHEISRAFHSEGLDYDLYCRPKRWSSTRGPRFSAKTRCMVEQYDAYSAEIDGEVKRIDGTMALPQSMSDDAGVRAAFMVYSQYEQEKTVPGLELTHHQMFFIKFAQNFCQNLPHQSLPDALRDLPNPFGKFRVMGTLSNLKEFSDAFKCPAGSPMNPEKKCKVW